MPSRKRNLVPDRDVGQTVLQPVQLISVQAVLDHGFIDTQAESGSGRLQQGTKLDSVSR